MDEFFGASAIGILVFKIETKDQFAQRLNRMFNVEIQVDNKLEKYKYTVAFVDEPLFQILDLLAIATPINYRVLPRTKKPDGTFSKQKIIIGRKK